MHIMAHPLLDSLEHLLNVSTDPVVLHYDTVINMGDYYMSTLTFRHGLFIGNPIIPCSFFIHSKRYHIDHREFLDAITETTTALLTKRVNLITDREFKFSGIFPVGTHLYCWNHIQNDLHWHLKTKGNCTAAEINYFTNAFRGLMKNELTESDFDRAWAELKNSEEFTSKPKIITYFEQNLLPSFKAHAAIWVLKTAGICNAEDGITNNPSESMNAVLHRLQQWKHVPLDVIAVSLYHLCQFYHREIERSIHQCGRFEIKTEYDHNKREPSLMPFLDFGLDPSGIVDKVKHDLNHNTDESTEKKLKPSASRANSQDGQMSLAQSAISNQRVKLVDGGAWIVMENDGITPRAVKLFPKETCSCSSTRTCFHITACRLMVGLPPNIHGQPNISELQRKESRKTERPSGRKKPRKNDFKQDDKRSNTDTCTCKFDFLTVHEYEVILFIRHLY